MQRIDGRAVYSATDLVGFLACEHLTNLDRAAMAGLVEKPHFEDLELDLIAKRGREHERRFLERLRAEGKEIAEIDAFAPGLPASERLGSASERTIAALRRGFPVVYQATLFDGRWLGYADFLVRIEERSGLGSWSYEVWDTKLARETKASALLQLCLYSDLLGALQGRRPELMHVALGGSAERVDHHRVSDYAAYYRLVKRQFEAFVAAAEPSFPPPTRPDPVEHCEVCRWNVECQRQRRQADDLSLVAGITGRQRRGLREHGFGTRRELALAPLPLPRIEGAGAEGLQRAREQARLQVQGETEGRVLHELLDPARGEDGTPAPNLGLLTLPEPSPGDLFFDIEGDPFALGDGVDYLFGVVEPGRPDASGNPAYHAFWARDAEGRVTLEAEKRAFQDLVDFIEARRREDPNLHIYHFAAYEPAALGRLMGRHATREDEIDGLLRGGVLVDLYRAVRQGVRVSVESYSIKKLEPLYGFERTVELRDAGRSLVEFSAWLDGWESGGGDAASLELIAGYNRDDCASTWKLRDWLEARRVDLASSLGEDLPRPLPGEPGPSAALSEHLQRVRDAEDALTSGAPADPMERSPAQQAQWLLAQLLSWHRREEKVSWWRYFSLLKDFTDAERVAEPEPIGQLSYVGEVRKVARSVIHRYRYPAQEHDLGAGAKVTDPATGKYAGIVEAVDDVACTIDLRRGRDSEAPHPTSLVPDLVVKTPKQRDSLLRIAESVIAHGIEGPGPHSAARELLLRRPPRLGQAEGAPLAPDEPAAKAARRLVLALDGGCLAVQGPPGSGKTTTGAEMILDLVGAGKRVGVTANSHKVIGHLLDCVAEAARERGADVRIGQKNGDDEPCTCCAAECYDDNGRFLRAIQDGEAQVAGATTWAWAREEFASAVDVLFVDEAGQMSLANAVAVSPSANSLVLLGDPQQLDQPLRGSHPPGSERSALAHLLDGESTMPPHLGLFFERTWRLHPEICAYTSESFYAGRLESEECCRGQLVSGHGVLDGTGLRFVPVVHTGNDRDSTEEAGEVARLVRVLLEGGATWVNEEGARRPLSPDDVLVITPYNAQVRTIAEVLPGARVGTVDKFQGQQAPISIYSMATSTPEDAPRGMEFLYSLNRLNVATSRARCLAIVVASPELVRVRCRTPRQMRLANAFCRFVEMSEREG